MEGPSHDDQEDLLLISDASPFVKPAFLALIVLLDLLQIGIQRNGMSQTIDSGTTIIGHFFNIL